MTVASGKVTARNRRSWKGVRVVDGNSLENCRAGNGTVGSNPTPSAKQQYRLQYVQHRCPKGKEQPARRVYPGVLRDEKNR